MRLFSMSIFILMMFSCASTKNFKTTMEHDLTIDAQLRREFQEKGAKRLLDHQLVPIDYLHKHPEIKGLLVNHYMGTGKTFLGIAFAQSYSDRPVIILAPKFLESHWYNELKSFGVTDLDRFTFVSYEAAGQKLADVDLSRHIILADEAHNLIRFMRGISEESNTQYAKVYSNIRKAYKILALTGTPIYQDESDIAFLINLVSGQDVMPFNQESFRLEYTKIMPVRQFFRGYFTESNLMVSTLPFALGIFGVATLGPIGLYAGFALGIGLPPAMNAIFDLSTFKLRKLDIEKMDPLVRKYVSYFRFDETEFKDFPAQEVKIIDIPYNRQQYSFFLRLVEGDLPNHELQRLLKNEPVKYDSDYVAINSSILHDKIYSQIGAGRDIGNYDFFDKTSGTVEAPKFLHLYNSLTKHPEQSVIYSNYFHTGILAFKDFLIRHHYKEKFAIIEPDLSIDEVNRIVSDYNNGSIKLLLLHPDITEGISLKGTQYLYILEPMINSNVQEQLIGRTRRFQSHSHLPPEKQIVHVRMYQSSSSTWSPELGSINRVNWFKRYREVAYMSRWGIGIAQIDKKFHDKALNPEEIAAVKLKTIEANFRDIQKLLTTSSIENLYKKP